ncbi:MAG: hypothetical protein ACI8W8_000994 [Rhodothermales bacterium]|jgi:hypothetical protein
MTTKQNSTKGKLRWILWLTALFLAILAFGPAFIPKQTASEQALRQHCTGNLQQILFALQMYADEYGEFPDQGLWQLAQGGHLSAGKVYQCPSVNHRGEELSLAALQAGTTDYVYLGASPASERDRMVDPILRDVTTNHHPDHFSWWRRAQSRSIGPWINVGFSDGSVEGFAAESWDELAERFGW